MRICVSNIWSAVVSLCLFTYISHSIQRFTVSHVHIMFKYLTRCKMKPDALFHILYEYTEWKFPEPLFILTVPLIPQSCPVQIKLSSLVTAQLCDGFCVPSYTCFTVCLWLTWSGKSLPSTSSLLDWPPGLWTSMPWLSKMATSSKTQTPS